MARTGSFVVGVRDSLDSVCDFDCYGPVLEKLGHVVMLALQCEVPARV
jgi:hypothetical protein